MGWDSLFAQLGEVTQIVPGKLIDEAKVKDRFRARPGDFTVTQIGETQFLMSNSQANQKYTIEMIVNDDGSVDFTGMPK